MSYPENYPAYSPPPAPPPRPLPVEPAPSSAASALASMSAVAAVLLAVLSILSLTANATLLRPAAYRQAFEATNLYERFPELLGRQLAAEGGPALPGIDTRAFFQNVTPEQYQAISFSLFPPDWVKVQANGLVDQVFGYLDSNQPDLTLHVDVSEVKARALGGEGQSAVGVVMQSWQPCGLDQASQFLSGGGVPVCKPPEMLMGAAQGAVHGMLSAPFRLMPDEIDLASGLTAVDRASGGRVVPSRLLNVLREARRWAWFLPLLALFFLLLAVLFGSRTARQGVTWVGVPLLLTGLATLLAVLLLLLLLNSVSGWVAGAFSGSLVRPAVMVMGDVLNYVGFRFLLAAGLVAGVLAVLGGGLLVIARSMKARI